MPRKHVGTQTAEAAPTVEIPSALLDELVRGPMTAAEVHAASLAFKKRRCRATGTGRLSRCSFRSTRNVQDVLIAVVDGLTGLVDALDTAFPQTTVQTCLVHLIRTSLDDTSWKDRQALRAFAGGPWGQRYPATVAQ